MIRTSPSVICLGACYQADLYFMQPIPTINAQSFAFCNCFCCWMTCSLVLTGTQRAVNKQCQKQKPFKTITISLGVLFCSLLMCFHLWWRCVHFMHLVLHSSHYYHKDQGKHWPWRPLLFIIMVMILSLRIHPPVLWGFFRSCLCCLGVCVVLVGSGVFCCAYFWGCALWVLVGSFWWIVGWFGFVVVCAVWGLFVWWFGWCSFVLLGLFICLFIFKLKRLLWDAFQSGATFTQWVDATLSINDAAETTWAILAPLEWNSDSCWRQHQEHTEHCSWSALQMVVLLPTPVMVSLEKVALTWNVILKLGFITVVIHTLPRGKEGEKAAVQ